MAAKTIGRFGGYWNVTLTAKSNTKNTGVQHYQNSKDLIPRCRSKPSNIISKPRRFDMYRKIRP